VSGSNSPSNFVNRNTASSIKPAQTKRALPVNTGGQLPTSHFDPALLPPQKLTTNNRLTPIQKLFLRSDTRRVSHCPPLLPMKFIAARLQIIFPNRTG
jgi:hypothetical protein